MQWFAASAFSCAEGLLKRAFMVNGSRLAATDVQRRGFFFGQKRKKAGVFVSVIGFGAPILNPCSCTLLGSQMDAIPRVLVIGAGASGLSFALACTARGWPVRIIDCRSARSGIEKATGIAQGVWNQLAPLGITSRAGVDAIPMRRFVFHDSGKSVADICVPAVNDSPPAFLYPQGKLEQLIEAALNEHGVSVEYGTSFLSLEQTANDAEVVLYKEGGEENQRFDWVIGADGAHSDVRRALQIPFVGRDYPERWSVAEASTRQWPTDIQAQLYLSSGGVGLFLSQPSIGVVQGIVNGPGAAAELKTRFADAELHYEREFCVCLRRVPTPRCGRVWLIGDAAHVQSPVGGQGLNLAIWDAITLANALMRGDLSVEQQMTKRARKVLFFTDFDYRLLATRNPILRQLRNLYWSLAARYPSISTWFFKTISGVW